MGKLFTILELAEGLRIHPDTVSKLIRDGKIAAAKIGKQWRISEEAINDYMKSRTIKVKA